MAGKFSGWSNYMYGFAKRGVSQNEAHKELRKLGLKVRNTTFNKEYGSWVGRVETGKRAKSVGLNKYYTKNTVNESPTLRKRNFRFNTKIDVVSKASGKRWTMDFSMASDKNLTPQMVGDECRRIIPEIFKPESDVIVERVVVQSVSHKEGRPWN